MPLGKQTTQTTEAVKLAKSLLAGGARHIREGNVVADLAFLLGEIGIDPSEIEREHPSGRGRIDIYVPRYRTIVEAKARGKAVDPDEKQAGQEESPREQLERYMEAEISAECEHPPLAGALPSYKRWTGIVTDGQHWHVYSYPHVRNPIEWGKTLHAGLVPGGAKELLDKLSEWMEGAPIGRRWIPADPSHLFENQAVELGRLYRGTPRSIRRSAQTKLALWHDMLRVSGMSPRGRAAPERLFVTHTFLIVVARMVTHSLTQRARDWKPVLKEGFVGWVIGWRRGETWARELWEIVSRHDWRRRRGDVLRSLYETFVPEADRKVFGEYYTPDWLAAMMVEKALDDEWLEGAIQKADDAIQNGTEFKGRGVLDPACGSGTFLYHAALRMLEAPAMQDLRPTQKSDVVALLLNGIDVHPVAVEIAKANLMRVLPAEPTAGESALRVHLGDSLLVGEDRGSLFGHVKGAMRLVTPEEREILIPEEFVKQDGFGDSMRRLVNAAASGHPVPPAVLNKVPTHRREDLERCRDDLAAAIGDEGNSVWTWYAINIAAPHLLSERKMDRIVANPPWVPLSRIQEPGRKRAMEELAGRMGLQAGGKQAPNLDIATFFILRSRELYLDDPENDPAVWLVKKSALSAGHWSLFREKHKKTLKQSVDLEPLQPFGSGDARRCCLLMEHRPFRSGAPIVARQRVAAAQSEARLEARLLPDPATRGHPKKPKPEESWTAIRHRVQFQAAPAPLSQAPSDYGVEAFRRGATVFPYVLLVAEKVFPQAFGRVRVRTRKSRHHPWNEVPSQDIEIPKQWLSKLYRSPDMLPFVASVGRTQAIIPVDKQGSLDLDSAQEEFGWVELDEIYRTHRGRGRNTPKTLADRINYGRGLSTQPRHQTSGRRMVLYPKSGDIMRAARTRTGSGFADDTLYWHVARSAREAGYLAALLNAPCLRRAFLESRESGRDFQLHPWRKVPIPRYDGKNRRHVALADLCERAERVAKAASDEVKHDFPEASQVKLSKAVRKRLAADGIFRSIEWIAARLLPDQVEMGSTDAPSPC